MAWRGGPTGRRRISALVSRLFAGRRVGRARRLGPGVEQLEARQLLAITVTEQNLASYKTSAGYVFTDAESITVHPGLVIDAAGGEITLTAPVIKIGDGAKLLSKGTGGAADGAITLTAANQTTTTPLSLINQFYANFASARGQDASIDVGKSATIDGGRVELDVVSGDALPQWWVDAVGEPVVGPLLKQASNTLNHILALPISVVIKQPESRLTVSEHVSITGSGSVTLDAKAVAQADARARWSVVMDYLQQKTKQTNWSFAGGFAYSDVRSSVSVGSGSSIVSTRSDVGITSDVVNSTTMKARVYLNQGVNPTNPNNTAFSVAVSVQNSASTVDLAAGSTIEARDAVEVKATGTDTNIARPKTSSYKDGRVGITAGVAVGTSVVEVFANGTIRSGAAATAASPLVVDPAVAVDFGTSTIRLSQPATFDTGDAVAYSARGGSAIPRLEDGTIYYAIVAGDRMSLRLAATPADALAGKAISFGPGYPTVAGAGTRGRLPIIGVTAAVDDTITLDATTWPDGTPFVDGEAITFAGVTGRFVGRNDAAGQLVGPLANGSYRIKVLPRESGPAMTRLRLLDAVDPTDTPIDLNTSAHFVTAGGVWLRVNEFDADMGQVNFTFPAAEAGVTDAPPDQAAAVRGLANAAALRYVEGFEASVPRLSDGTTYHAIVDPDNRGIVRLAATADQARAADPAVQDASPTLSFSVPGESLVDSPTIKTVEIAGVEGGSTLVFQGAPGIADGTIVTY
ncbi:MAG: hypothetical protein ACKO3G_12540, partial [Planctomycetaceae bacterium]